MLQYSAVFEMLSMIYPNEVMGKMEVIWAQQWNNDSYETNLLVDKQTEPLSRLSDSPDCWCILFYLVTVFIALHTKMIYPSQSDNLPHIENASKEVLGLWPKSSTWVLSSWALASGSIYFR